MANSDSVKIGDQVMVIGAPYGLSHSMTVGWISARWAPNTVYKRCRWPSSSRRTP
jgi:serine protease Do